MLELALLFAPLILLLSFTIQAFTEYKRRKATGALRWKEKTIIVIGISILVTALIILAYAFLGNPFAPEIVDQRTDDLAYYMDLGISFFLVLIFPWLVYLTIRKVVK